MSAAGQFPNLHRIAYGEGARLTAEARVEAADALERLSRSCETCAYGVRKPGFSSLRCARFFIWIAPEHACALWSAPSLTSAHDKEKS